MVHTVVDSPLCWIAENSWTSIGALRFLAPTPVSESDDFEPVVPGSAVPASWEDEEEDLALKKAMV